ncbi:hypothetical protein AG1IA_01181 [Rhizoctonia solani AG-1 IA]|uniref:Uncharacterized protein n=1 Tax=Thanatephorus cucumeris (strain AG1-IA) TaxID=983506 RepID=L8X702_THACA|nr:hypothetical protein AG1IA_01181 [Rhizoctonia solani AG-1 IA]
MRVAPTAGRYSIWECMVEVQRSVRAMYQAGVLPCVAFWSKCTYRGIKWPVMFRTSEREVLPVLIDRVLRLSPGVQSAIFQEHMAARLLAIRNLPPITASSCRVHRSSVGRNSIVELMLILSSTLVIYTSTRS